MPDFALSQGILFLAYGAAGCAFGLLFHFLSLFYRLFQIRWFRGRRVRKTCWITTLGDLLFWLLFTIVFYVMNFNLTSGEIRGFTLLAMALGAAVVVLPVTAVAKRLRRQRLRRRRP